MGNLFAVVFEYQVATLQIGYTHSGSVCRWIANVVKIPCAFVLLGREQLL